LNLTPKKIECGHSEIDRVLIPLLRGRLFHVTKTEAFEDICRRGLISSSPPTSIALTYRELENSYGRKRSWVSLYDLSDPTDGQIKEALIHYWFIQALRNENPLVCLILAESVWPSLISWKRASREVGGKEFFIPFVEAWYPGDLPLQLVTDSFVFTCR
jgi:hypothetical protein